MFKKKLRKKVDDVSFVRGEATLDASFLGDVEAKSAGVKSRFGSRGSDGFSLTEMVVAVGILGIITPTIIGISLTAFKADKQARDTIQNTGNFKVVSTMLDTSMDNSVYSGLNTNGDIVIRTKQNVCNVYAVKDGKFKYKKYSADVDASNIPGFTDLQGADLKDGSSLTLGNGVLNYDLKLDSGDIKGAATQKIVNTGAGGCQ